MIKIGMLIADRYEILEKVGTGGMADVYKSKDHTLNRYVAVKVLKQEFSENANFVSKFRVEAQAAAGLAHPNIVNIYDVGEEKGIYYIVMELVDGITLKNYIEKKGHLSYQEAVTIAIHVSMGIEAAHRNHIIHRDIKPQNIIISKDGKVKVTDFGIAKAATSDTITSNVMGSVHYTSPEQARGGYSDEKSDVYSLGVTLFEMLTGCVPFDGETTVAIAIRHIKDPMPSPAEYVGGIPKSVCDIVLKCCEKSPDRRYQNMGELQADLKRSLTDPDGDFVKSVDPSEMGNTRAMTEEEKRRINEMTDDSQLIDDEIFRTVSGSGVGYDDSDINVPKPGKGKYSEELVEEEEEEEEEREQSMDRFAAILIVLAVIIIIAIIGLLMGGRSGLYSLGRNGRDNTGAESTEMVIMPTVVGQDVSTARAALVKQGLIPEIVYQQSDKFSVGVVMSASEKEGSSIPVGTTVVLTVCGNSGTEVPDVIGMERLEAVSLLTDKGFNVTVTEKYSEDIEEDVVISQDPISGVQAEEGSYVTIVVSIGPDMSGKIEMPNLLGMTEQEARGTLSALGLRTGNVRTVIDMDENNRGLVIAQDVEPGEYLDEGTAVNFDVAGQQTYSYSAGISAPTYNEDPDYKSGTAVHIEIVTDSGKTLLDTTTSAFPYLVSYTGIASSSGTLTMTYDVVIEETIREEVEVEDDEEVPDEPAEPGDEAEEESEGGESVKPGPTPKTKIIERVEEHTESRTVTRELDFTPEN